MKIYTKTGDDGTTALLGGKRVAKNDLKIEAYGTVDELNSFLGLLRDSIETTAIRDVLKSIQETLFTIGSHLALAAPEKEHEWLPEIKKEHIELLEKEMDRMENTLEPLKNFILPGGHPIVSYSHICRSVCRRAERNVVTLGKLETVKPIIIQYLNRLSDYFFVLARYLAKQVNAKEITWTS